MQRAKRFCKHSGCNALTANTYCDVHVGDAELNRRYHDKRRGSSRQRGYTYVWEKYSKAFLRRPENQFCKLHMDNGCNVISQCVDHVDPPDGPDDSRFWDAQNHQAACIYCNSKKGHRKIVGRYEFGKEGN